MITDGVLANAANFNAAFESKNKSVRDVSTSGSILSTDYFINANGTGGITLTLPDESTNTGRFFIIKRTAGSLSDAVTIERAGSDQIDVNGILTNLSRLRTNGECITLQAAGGGIWRIISRYIPNGWQTWTPIVTTTSGTMTNFTATGSWRREGSEMIARFLISFTGAVGTWTEPIIALPTGLVYDTSRIYIGPNGSQQFGFCSLEDSANQNFTGGVAYWTSNRVIIFVNNASATYGLRSGVTNAIPFSFASGDGISGEFRVPILNWEG